MNQMRQLMEAVNDVFDLLPADQGAARRQEMADRSAQAAWDVYRSQPEELARRVKLLAQHPKSASLYAREVLGQPWHQVKEIDAAIVSQAHQSIASDGRWAYWYALFVLRQPWHQAPGIDAALAGQAHQSIASDGGWAYEYALNVLRRPWHQVKEIDPATAGQAHQSIASDHESAYGYAHYVLRQPWHQVKEIDAVIVSQAHQSIASDKVWAQAYAKHFDLDYDAATKSFVPKKQNTNQLSEQRSPDNISDQEVSLFIMSMQNLVTKNRRTNKKAANVYHDVVKKGNDQFVSWLQEHAVPLWEKYGYPEIGSRKWEEFQEKFEWTFLKDTSSPETRAHFNKLKKHRNS